MLCNVMQCDGYNASQPQGNIPQHQFNPAYLLFLLVIQEIQSDFQQHLLVCVLWLGKRFSVQHHDH